MSDEVADVWAGPVSRPDRYRLVRRESAGGEGEVWRGSLRVDEIEIAVAVKVIHPSQVAELDEWRERWHRQADLLRSLDHRGIVKVREVFEGPLPHPAGCADASSLSLYLVMNWVEGPTLERWVGLNPARAVLDSVRIVGELANAVDYLHAGPVNGSAILHRDIKPSNVILTSSGPVLVDFGFMRGVEAHSMTVVGSLAYMAPEVVLGADPSTATDRFCLGGTAYFLLTGKRPNLADRAGMQASLAGVGGDVLAERVMAMLDPVPDQRPATAVAWAHQLEASVIPADEGDEADTVIRPSPRVEDPTVIRPTPATVQSAPTGPVTAAQVNGTSKRRRAGAAVAVAVTAITAGIVGTNLFTDDSPDTATPQTTERSAEPTTNTTALSTTPSPTEPTIAHATSPVQVPGVPQGVTMRVDGGDVVAEWPAVAGATNYLLEYSVDDRAWVQVPDMVRAEPTGRVVGGNGHKVTVRVRAVNSAGTSAKSQPATINARTKISNVVFGDRPFDLTIEKATSSWSPGGYSTGDCMNLKDVSGSSDGSAVEFTPVPCSMLHAYEYIGTFSYDGGTYKSETEIKDKGREVCLQFVEDYLGVPYDEQSPFTYWVWHQPDPSVDDDINCVLAQVVELPWTNSAMGWQP